MRAFLSIQAVRVHNHLAWSLTRYGTQRGAMLLIMAFIVAMLAMMFMFKILNVNALQSLQQEKTMHALHQAKQTMIDWAVSHPNHPGQLPFPDRNADGNYDGLSDCNSPTSVFQYSFLIGQLPILGRSNPCIAPQENLGPHLEDAFGNRLWFAVSRNLVRRYEGTPANPEIHPGIISNPAFPWLRVLDRNGAVISDRVAVVIIAPGPALLGQNRADAASVNHFLDSATIGGVFYSNSDYDQPDEDFILAEHSQFVKDTNPTVSHPYLFNDRLVYITIDELISALQKRVAQETRWLLNSYRAKTGAFPNAADFSTATFASNQYISGASNAGLVPVDATDTGCGCVSETSCSCRFGPIASVTMLRENGTWNSAQDTGACVSTAAASGRECRCTGAGSCTRFATSFVCDAAGNCDSNNLTPSANNRFIYRLPAYADFHNPTGGCVLAGQILQCNMTGSFGIGLNEPAWFKANRWPENLYFRWSAANDLSAGAQTGLSAILIAVGDMITSEMGVTQARPSSSLADYLDSLENTNADAQYESVLKRKSNAYNDEVFIIAP